MQLLGGKHTILSIINRRVVGQNVGREQKRRWGNPSAVTVSLTHMGSTKWVSCPNRRIINTEKPPFLAVFLFFWSEMGDSNSRHPAPKPMSEPSCRPVAPSLTLSGTPAVPLWNSFALFVSGTAFVFWDLCGMKFCILKVLPTSFMPRHRAILPRRTVQKLRCINNEISPTWKLF